MLSGKHARGLRQRGAPAHNRVLVLVAAYAAPSTVTDAEHYARCRARNAASLTRRRVIFQNIEGGHRALFGFCNPSYMHAEQGQPILVVSSSLCSTLTRPCCTPGPAPRVCSTQAVWRRIRQSLQAQSDWRQMGRSSPMPASRCSHSSPPSCAVSPAPAPCQVLASLSVLHVAGNDRAADPADGHTLALTHPLSLSLFLIPISI